MDSSFLTMPLGNDLLVVALSASHHSRMPYYVLMAAVGSVMGCLVDDWLSRKGKHGIKKHVQRKRLHYVER
jgi:membrane protein YqaA with SNARE-associated domain